MKQLSANEALTKLAAYCSSAERCIQDIKKKLIRWEIPQEKHQEIITRLQQEKFLDEKRYSKAFVNDKTAFNKWGHNKIRYELKKKGIVEDIISEALENINIEKRREVLQQLLQLKSKSVKGKNEYEIRQKLVRFAFGRGFSLDDINHCMKKLFKEYEDLSF